MNTENHYQETDLGNISLNPRGEYNPEESYEYLDLVVLEGGSYVCLAENGATITGISPESGKTTQYWQVITIPGSLTPEYIAMHDRVVNLSEQVGADAVEVRTAEQNVSGMELNVTQMQERTRQSAEAAEQSKDSSAGYAASADSSRQAAEESEQNVNAQVSGFDNHVAEKTEEAENDIEAVRIAANKAIIAQQEQSVNEVARVGIEAISTAQAAAQIATEKAQAAATSEKNAAASETAAKLSETNATKMAEQVAADKEQVANDRTAVEKAKQEMTESVAQIEQNTQGIADLKGDIVYQLNNGIIKINSKFSHKGNVYSGSNVFFEYNFENTKKYLIDVHAIGTVNGNVYFTTRTSDNTIADENFAYIKTDDKNISFEYYPVINSQKVYFYTESPTKDIIFNIYEIDTVCDELNERIKNAENGNIYISDKMSFRKKIGKGVYKYCDVNLKKGKKYKILVNRAFSTDGVTAISSKLNEVIVDEDFYKSTTNGITEIQYIPKNDVDSLYTFSNIDKCNLVVDIIEFENICESIDELTSGIYDETFCAKTNASRKSTELSKIFDIGINAYTNYKMVFDVTSVADDNYIAIDTRDINNNVVESALVGSKVSVGKNVLKFTPKKDATSLYMYSKGSLSGSLYLYEYKDINDIAEKTSKSYDLSSKAIEQEGYIITCFPSNDEANKIDLKLSYDGVSTIHVGTIYEGNGFLCRDPDIFKIGQHYYCTFTGTSMKIIRSKDLINWEDYKDFTPNFDDFEINPDSFWAPEFFRDNDGSLYLSFAAHQKTTSDSKGFITQSFVLKFDDDTLNSYSGLQQITYPDIDPNYSFDSTFYNDNGTYYMCSHGTNANIYTSNSVYGEFTKKAKIPSSNYAEGFTILKNGDYFFFYCDEKQDGTENSMCLILYKTKDFLNWERFNLGNRTRHCKLLPMTGLDRAISERAYMKLNFND